jgi:hypothetical protein
MWRINLAKEWLQTCIRSHPECNQEQTCRRCCLLKKSSSPKFQLILTSQVLPNQRYGPKPTPSHCWGKMCFCSLPTHTLPQLLQGIDISILPETFQDAVKMTTSFGVEHLLIDSLCIMQDLIEDWRVESALMGSIYSNSLCNIAATGWADGSGGISMNGWSLLNLPCFGESIPHFDSPTTVR